MTSQTESVCHIDVGYSRQVAAIMGIQPTTLILCGAKDGLTIRDDRVAIKVDGSYPAACNCGACQAIAWIMHSEDIEPTLARARYRRQHR